jgi:hypothetical protein
LAVFNNSYKYGLLARHLEEVLSAPVGFKRLMVTGVQLATTRAGNDALTNNRAILVVQLIAGETTAARGGKDTGAIDGSSVYA